MARGKTNHEIQLSSDRILVITFHYDLFFFFQKKMLMVRNNKRYFILSRSVSSVVEHSTADREATGSNPVPTYFGVTPPSLSIY